MNVVLIESSEIIDQRVTLKGERAKHVAKVLRSSIGDSIRIGIIDDRLGTGIIEKITRKQPYSVVVHVALTDVPPAPSNVDIILALPRPIMFKRVLSQATTLGVKNFFIINAGRVEKSFWNAGVVDELVYRTHLLKGLEQAIDTTVPSVRFYRGFKSFVDDIVPEIKGDYGYLTVADPRFSNTSDTLINKGPGRVLLAIGPEGGWLDYEVDRMVEAGFKGLGFGTRILRVDTAVIALHSVVANSSLGIHLSLNQPD